MISLLASSLRLRSCVDSCLSSEERDQPMLGIYRTNDPRRSDRSGSDNNCWAARWTFRLAGQSSVLQCFIHSQRWQWPKCRIFAILERQRKIRRWKDIGQTIEIRTRVTSFQRLRRCQCPLRSLVSAWSLPLVPSNMMERTGWSWRIRVQQGEQVSTSIPATRQVLVNSSTQ